MCGEEPEPPAGRGDRTVPVVLSRRHEIPLARFLSARAAASPVLLANAEAGGLEDRGRPLQGTFAAFLDDGATSGVAAHYWNGMVFLQSDEGAPALVHAAMSASGRDCSGIAGSYAQVQEVFREVFSDRADPALNGRDPLFSCALSTSGPFDRYAGDPACRQPAEAELPEAVELRRAFMREHLGTRMRPEQEGAVPRVDDRVDPPGDHRRRACDCGRDERDHRDDQAPGGLDGIKRVAQDCYIHGFKVIHGELGQMIPQ